MSISVILSECLSGVGEYKLKPYCEKRWLFLHDLIIWSGSDRSGYSREVRFSDHTWKPIGEKHSISFNDLSNEFQYEFKLITLALYTSGVGEGMPALKWSTIIHGIRSLRLLARFLQTKHINSWMELNRIHKLKRINYFSEAMNVVGAISKPRLSYTLNTSIKWLVYYDLLNQESSKIIFDKLNSIVSIYQKNDNKKHPVIPTRVLKVLISQVIAELDLIEKNIGSWIEFQKSEIHRIQAHQFKIINGRYQGLSNTKKIKATFLNINRVRGLVNILVLAFTGMRDGESLALKHDCLVVREDNNGDLIYFLSSELTKTTEGVQKVEWVCGETVAKYIKLICSLNEIVYEKALSIINHMALEISDEYLNELQQGLKHKHIFSSSYALTGCGFFSMNKRPVTAAFNISSFFKIPVDLSDIQQLDRLGCNYKSVAPNNIEKHQKYEPGDYFNFTPHQFRHTFAWFIIANRLGELDDIRYQYKHLWLNMTLVYAQRGFDSVGELLNIADELSEKITHLTVKDIVESSLNGKVAGNGGVRFSARIKEMLGNQTSNSIQPQFKDMNQLVDFISNNSNDLRGVAHGYCTKNRECKVKNIADPSHCIYCDGYIATPRHLPYWKAIQVSCEHKIQVIESATDDARAKLDSFYLVLKSNLIAANTIIQQLESSEGINLA